MSRAALRRPRSPPPSKFSGTGRPLQPPLNPFEAHGLKTSLSPFDIFLCLGFSLALPVGQLMFKWGAEYSRGLDGGFIAKLVFNWPLMGAFAWYGLTSILWFYILTRTPLSVAYPFSLVGAALVPIVGWVVFREAMTFNSLIGYVLIIAGMVFVMRSP